jgi:hypothetical protein
VRPGVGIGAVAHADMAEAIVQILIEEDLIRIGEVGPYFRRSQGHIELHHRQL